MSPARAHAIMASVKLSLFFCYGDVHYGMHAQMRLATSKRHRLLKVVPLYLNANVSYTGQLVVAPGAGAGVHPRGRVVHRPVIVTTDATPETPWVPQAVALFEGVLELAPKFA